jgi:hypothetical protein
VIERNRGAECYAIETDHVISDEKRRNIFRRYFGTMLQVGRSRFRVPMR